MTKILPKTYWIIVLTAVTVFIIYISFMAVLDGGFRVDLTNRVQLSVEDQTIELPWYLRIGTSYEGSYNRIGVTGLHYTCFVYSLPEMFESAEIDCVVCWETQKVIAVIGDSRGMFVVDEMFAFAERIPNSV